MLAWISVLLPERNTSVSPWTSLLICSYPIIEVGFSFVRKDDSRRLPPQPARWRASAYAGQQTLGQESILSFSKPIQNGLTSPFLWMYAAVPCLMAVLTYQNKWLTASCFFISVICYLAFYSKLAYFRWIRKK
jgi:hypothetical protein